MKSERLNVSDLMRLDRVLDEERDALLRGHFQGLDHSYRIKFLEKHSKLNFSDLRDFRVQVIRRKLKRNEKLYDSAVKGIESAKNRLNDISRAKQKLTTYTKNGKSEKVMLTGSSCFERKF